MPDSWRGDILREFAPQVSRLTLVADPDDLLAEEGILREIQSRGFDLLPYEDPVAFRYAYESRYRARWDRGDTAYLVVVVRGDAHALDRLPFDLLKVGRRVTFGLGRLFPSLSYPVIAALDHSDLEALYEAQQRARPGPLGDNATKDFILRHVFDFDAARIDNTAELLRVLLRRHYRRQRIPPILDERLIQVLQENKQFADWPLDRIVPDREALLRFLQERWPIFLDHLAGREPRTVREPATAYALEYAGPSVLPFEHKDVRAYIDNLFHDGLLKPVGHEDAGELAKQWVEVGLLIDPEADRARQIEGLLSSIESSLPPDAAKYQEWLDMAYVWARLLVLRYQGSISAWPELKERFISLRTRLDSTFLTWVQQRYGGLQSLPAQPPVMLHHIPRALAGALASGAHQKIALVVLDGLSVDQWLVLQAVLEGQRPLLRWRQEAVFAWLPTLTSVSRQSIFAGLQPLYYPESIYSTHKEPALWATFWSGHGLTGPAVAYMKGLNDRVDLTNLNEAVSHPKCRVIGLVVDTVDNIMHGMQLGTAGMHNQVRQWADLGFPGRLLDILLDHGFAVYLTSDHGNIGAKGCGKPAEGVLSEVRGVRARVYSEEVLRAQVQQKFPTAVAWPPVGLPQDFLALLAPNRAAFVTEGQHIVAHGGISLEELVVPYIEIEARRA